MPARSIRCRAPRTTSRTRSTHTPREWRHRSSSSACRGTAGRGRPSRTRSTRRTQTGLKFGASNSVLYDTAADYAKQYGKRWDSREQSPWIAYRRQNCSTTYGCVMTWRQVYYDDADSLKLRYDMINRMGLRERGSGRSAMTPIGPTCARPSPRSSSTTRPRRWPASRPSSRARRPRRSRFRGSAPTRAASATTTSRCRSTAGRGTTGSSTRRRRAPRTRAPTRTGSPSGLAPATRTATSARGTSPASINPT